MRLAGLLLIAQLVLVGSLANSACIHAHAVRPAAWSGSSATTSSQALSMTGVFVPSMRSFDRIVTETMMKHSIPGGAVAVAKDGRLVLARGYGLADVGLNQPVQPGSLFRIGSISKQITAVTILRLVEEERLDLDAKVFRLLDHLKPFSGVSVDPRVYNVTIRQLLQHSGGWDPYRTQLDPMFGVREIAEATDAPAPAGPETIVRFMLGRRLDFDPGTYFAYCNFGYSVLGRIVEKVTGQNYEQYVKSRVLEPMGITRMRIGHSLLEGRANGEVRYYDYPDAPLAKSVFSNVSDPVPRPYGSFYVETLESCGGWIGSPIDLLRFVTAVDGRRQPRFLKPETVRLMVSPPARLWLGTTYGYRWAGKYYYGMGWFVRPVGVDADWWHTGSIPGTTAIHVRTHDGLAWAALFNSRPKDIETFRYELNDALWQAAHEVTDWPTHNLFEQYQTLSTTNAASSAVSTTSTSSSVTRILTADYVTAIVVLSVGILISAIGMSLYRNRVREKAVKTPPHPKNQLSSRTVAVRPCQP